MNEWLLHVSFGLGGGVGAVSRHMLAQLVTHRFPFATLIVNVVGCFILGIGVAQLENLPGYGGEEARGLVYGFCGGLTTFSSFAYQTLDLHRSFTILHAAGNIIVSLVLCLSVFWGGLALAGGW